MAQILGFLFAGASTVLALAMLLLVVWQAPRHRRNRLMAVYLATLVFWGASNLAARLSAVLGASPQVFIYGHLLGAGLNAIALFWNGRAFPRASMPPPWWRGSTAITRRPAPWPACS